MISNDKHKKHKKHGKLTRPKLNRFGRFELCLVGTTCDSIAAFVEMFKEYCPANLKVAYVDASHKEIKHAQKSVQHACFENECFQLTVSKENEWHLRHELLDADIVFVNGNHFEASHQIVFIDEAKESSLKKRMSWINDIQFILKSTESQEIFSFIEEDKYAKALSFLKSDTSNIFSSILDLYTKNIAQIKALVLGGGESLRMGRDKSKLDYYGEAQEAYLAKMIQGLDIEVYSSKRVYDPDSEFPVLVDRVSDMGPFGAILSAFMDQPDIAWLVIACDLPFISESEIISLLEKRDPSKIATTFKATDKDFPEPLITIWEPKAYPVLLKFLAQGVSCPRKVLINSDIKEILLENSKIVANVNTPEEYIEAKNYLSRKTD